MVVIYDGDERSILLRAVWGGRQKNEYWNSFTLAALITGSVSLFLMSYLFLSHPLYRQAALFALTLGFFPLATLLPPGGTVQFCLSLSVEARSFAPGSAGSVSLAVALFSGKS